MGANIDECTRAIRTQQWVGIVKACNDSGKSRAEWCTENRIGLKKFYYWQNKLKNEAVDKVTKQTESCEIVPLKIADKVDLNDTTVTSKITIKKSDISIEIADGTTAQTVEMILKVLMKPC